MDIAAYTLPMHTVTFQAANGYQETYQCWNWDEFHVSCQVMETRGFSRGGWVDRSGEMSAMERYNRAMERV